MTIEDVVKKVRVYGLDESIAASKYPMAVSTDKCTSEITNRTKTLAGCEKGTGHDCFLKGIIVQFDLTFSIKAWVEAERYHWFDFVSSQSTMHKITSFDPDLQCNEYVTQKAVDNLKECIEGYNITGTKDAYLQVLYNVPVGFGLTARISTNYLQLKTIYAQRKTHRLPDWNVFCKWIETLPHAEFIIGFEE